MLWLIRRKTLKWAQRLVVLTIMLAAYKPRARAFLYGGNDLEENLLVTTLALSRAYGGQIVLMADDPSIARRGLEILAGVIGGDVSRIEVRKSSIPSGVRLFGSSELVFSTHFRFSGPGGIGRRLIVNLTHGTGPKEVRNARSGATVMAGCARLWLPAQAQSQRMPRNASFVTGNPRQDLLSEGRPRADLFPLLGLDPSVPLLLWMPTYRHSDRASYRGSVIEGIEFERSEQVRRFAVDLQSAAVGRGVQVVVKTHPMDDTDFGVFGIRTLRSQEIWEAGSSLYELIGCADGLISDFSSVWVDFLDTERSLAFFMHDAHEFGSSRGFLPGPDVRDLTAPLTLSVGRDIQELIDDLSACRTFRATELESLRSRVGYVEAKRRRYRLLSELREVGIARHRFAFNLQVGEEGDEPTRWPGARTSC